MLILCRVIVYLYLLLLCLSQLVSQQWSDGVYAMLYTWFQFFFLTFHGGENRPMEATLHTKTLTTFGLTAEFSFHRSSLQWGLPIWNCFNTSDGRKEMAGGQKIKQAFSGDRRFFQLKILNGCHLSAFQAMVNRLNTGPCNIQREDRLHDGWNSRWFGIFRSTRLGNFEHSMPNNVLQFKISFPVNLIKPNCSKLNGHSTLFPSENYVLEFQHGVLTFLSFLSQILQTVIPSLLQIYAVVTDFFHQKKATQPSLPLNDALIFVFTTQS